MPNFNQKGPYGQGPMTGRKMGRCTNYGENFKNLSTENNPNNANENFPENIQERGLGYGRGMGLGRSRGGRGRGFGQQNRFRGGL